MTWVPKYKIGDILIWQSNHDSNLPKYTELKIIGIEYNIDNNGGIYTFEEGSMWGPIIDEEAVLNYTWMIFCNICDCNLDYC